MLVLQDTIYQGLQEGNYVLLREIYGEFLYILIYEIEKLGGFNFFYGSANSVYHVVKVGNHSKPKLVVSSCHLQSFKSLER